MESIAIISDDLSHSKCAVWAFLKLIATFIKESFPLVKSLLIFSDNAASQFKSRFTISNVCFLEMDLDFEYVEWNTFAPYHGKGAFDGVGGSLKHLMWTKVKSENLKINSAKDYYMVANETCEKTLVFYVPSEDIKENAKL